MRRKVNAAETIEEAERLFFGTSRKRSCYQPLQLGRLQFAWLLDDELRRRLVLPVGSRRTISPKPADFKGFPSPFSAISAAFRGGTSECRDVTSRQ